MIYAAPTGAEALLSGKLPILRGAPIAEAIAEHPKEYLNTTMHRVALRVLRGTAESVRRTRPGALRPRRAQKRSGGAAPALSRLGPNDQEGPAPRFTRAG